MLGGELKHKLRRLRVGQKIGLGYAIALGIAVAGTATGIVIGEHYQQQAWAREEHAQTEIELLHRLQSGVLQARTHQQQLIPLLADYQSFQEEYGHLQKHIAEIRQTWTAIQDFGKHSEHTDEMHSEAMPTFLRNYEGVPNTYFATLETLVNQIQPTTLQSAAEVATAQRQLLTFTNSDLALKFDGISDDLVELIQVSYRENQEAAQAEEVADVLRLRIIAVSIFLSVAIAAISARITSRMITEPLQAVTHVAKEVTLASNFDLQVPVTTDDEVGVVATSLNQMIQRVKQLLEEQKATAAQQLIQSEKMSSLGQMVAGVAHEINNPVNFIYGNLVHASQYVDDLFDLIHTYEAEISHPPDTVIDKAEEIDRDFLETDLPKLLQSMKTGAERARQIVLSLRNFSRLDESAAHPVDLHDCLDSTLLILNNRLKKGITVERQYGNVPLIEGYASSLYQVFMNLLSNAVDVLGDPTQNSEIAESNPSTPTITIKTERLNSEQVVVRIADNGPGMPPEVQAKIFDPFFTTKPTGIGTGLGLSISRQIVEEKHGGQLICQSTVGVGTEFAVILPLQHQPQPPKAPQLVAT